MKDAKDAEQMAIELVAKQGAELINFCRMDLDSSRRMSQFMKTTVDPFLTFTIEQRRLLLKFLIETHEMAEGIVNEAVDKIFTEVIKKQ